MKVISWLCASVYCGGMLHYEYVMVPSVALETCRRFICMGLCKNPWLNSRCFIKRNVFLEVIITIYKVLNLNLHQVEVICLFCCTRIM